MLGYGKFIVLLVIVWHLRPTNSSRCLREYPEVNPKRIVQLESLSLPIRFELTNRVSQRLVTRVMRIFLIEVLGYAAATLTYIDDDFAVTPAFMRVGDNFDLNLEGIPNTMVNMEVWIPPQNDSTKLMQQYKVRECGSITSPGRLGWFVPEELSDIGDTWITFTNRQTAERFSVDDETLELIKQYTTNPSTGAFYCEKSFCEESMYIPPQCQTPRNKTQGCALLLTSEVNGTKVVKDHIDQLKLYVQVIWVGPHLRNLTTSLTKQYISSNKLTDIKKSLVVLYWTPSDVIPNERNFINVDFPRCGSRNSKIGCTYETNRLVKLAWAKLEDIGKLALEAINRAKFTEVQYEDLLIRYNRLSGIQSEEDIACGWLRDNLNYTLTHWEPTNGDKNTLYVGGIFPMTNSAYTDKAILLAAVMAKKALNDNTTLLRDYNLVLLAGDGQCKTDTVMRSFIDYIFHNYYEKLIGVLGPACSETVEPLVGVSKHYSTVVISYGAEGSSFNDRSRYPYFFRTIAENKQYRHVYLQLLQNFGWTRVAALTEDGQKYTEYLSYLQDMMRDNGISIIANIKFPREREPNQMTQYLEHLKEKSARIIIADVYDAIARELMCQAHKLEMTPEQGYVWFLPLWLGHDWYDTEYHNSEYGETVSCTVDEMFAAINGHFSISNAYFAGDEDTMQTGATVATWRESYEALCRHHHLPPSIYAGYAYDATWTYGLALHQLLKENQSYVFDLHSELTVNRFTNIIAETDFQGVSGHIKFFGGPSRISTINIMQRIHNETRIVGQFYPEMDLTKHEITGGHLKLNESSIAWLTGSVPTDGSEPPQRCVLASLAELLDVSCEVAIIIANIIGLILLLAFLIAAFIIAKRKYDAKVREHEKVMESFGLDPRLATTGLDKWEIPRDRVVINRKLGEGAFGTVYGGETFFPDKGWLAVAVKTLKDGSTTEEKLDFLSEVEVMKRFEHKNIIKLLGVCINSAPVLTVMEFMLYGDLKTYLLARRHLVNDQNYEDSDEISNKKLTAMALDVARALGYLAQIKYIHRDVASRNCLINAQRVVKLGDFGMTRPMYENDYYKFSRKGMLPVRWMAPESLGLGIFSPASDVWAYGVLMYEIVTFGSFPFQGMCNNEVLAHVKAGNSLRAPKGVKPALEGLLKSCWLVDHAQRPTAAEIVDFLASNPRVVSPCLDVPLASVQLESPSQIEFPLHENVRKFSQQLSWPVTSGQTIESNSSTYIVSDGNNAPLLDIHQDHDQSESSGLMHDGLTPLLAGDDSPKLFKLNNIKPEDIPRYVNLESYETRPGHNGELQMRERCVEETREEQDRISVF